MITKKLISTSSLMLAMFFLPFGYDALFKFIMDATGSYWTADMIFYGIAASFFLLHLGCEGILQRTFKKIMSFVPLSRTSSR